MIDPNSPEGLNVAALLQESVDQVRREMALAVAKGSSPGRNPVAWAKAAQTAVGPVSADFWPRIWPELRRRCEAQGIDYPFSTEDERGIMAEMADRT